MEKTTLKEQKPVVAAVELKNVELKDLTFLNKPPKNEKPKAAQGKEVKKDPYEFSGEATSEEVEISF